MDNKQYYRDNCPDDVPFFSRPQWLDFICPGKWDVALVMENDKIRALMPYMVNDMKRPTRIIMPPHTKFSGPCLVIEKTKPSSYITEEIRLLSKLEKQLPDVKYFRQSWHPEYMNCLPFLWEKYKVNIKYCYEIKNVRSAALAWDGLDEDNRRLIRKARQNNISIIIKNDPDCFFGIIKKVFEKQNVENPYDMDFLCKLSGFLVDNDCGTMAFAVDNKQVARACALVLYDKNTQYLFAGGIDPSYRNSGANVLLIWSFIEKSIANNQDFNFLGSVIKSKESFIRSFGGQIFPYLDIVKDNTVFTRIKDSIKSVFQGSVLAPLNPTPLP